MLVHSLAGTVEGCPYPQLLIVDSISPAPFFCQAVVSPQWGIPLNTRIRCRRNPNPRITFGAVLCSMWLLDRARTATQIFLKIMRCKDGGGGVLRTTQYSKTIAPALPYHHTTHHDRARFDATMHCRSNKRDAASATQKGWNRRRGAAGRSRRLAMLRRPPSPRSSWRMCRWSRNCDIAARPLV